MPVLTPRQQILKATRIASANDQLSMDDCGIMNQQLWLANNHFEGSEEQLGYPPHPLGDTPSRKGSVGELRLTTYSGPDLHERYMSSEEEASPSPDSETISQYDRNDCRRQEANEAGTEEEHVESKQKCVNIECEAFEESTELYLEECQPEIAVAVPIMAIGQPKLVDISNLAPMQKKKRINPNAMLPRTAQKVVDPRGSAIRARHSHQVYQTAQPIIAPESWLPEEEVTLSEEDPDQLPSLHLRNPPSYNDYDPYSLNPPRLSPRSSYSASAKKPGSVARARKQTTTPRAIDNTPGLR